MRALLQLFTLASLLLIQAGCSTDSTDRVAFTEENLPETPTESTKSKLAPKITMNNGLQLPAAGIGTYSLHGNTCFNSVYTALQNGVRLIDTAYMYGNEEKVGKAVRQAIADGICKREDITVITKNLL